MRDPRGNLAIGSFRSGEPLDTSANGLGVRFTLTMTAWAGKSRSYAAGGHLAVDRRLDGLIRGTWAGLGPMG